MTHRLARPGDPVGQRRQHVVAASRARPRSRRAARRPPRACRRPPRRGRSAGAGPSTTADRRRRPCGSGPVQRPPTARRAAARGRRRGRGGPSATVGQPEVGRQHRVVDVREQAVQPGLPAAAVEQHRDASRGASAASTSAAARWWPSTSSAVAPSSTLEARAPGRSGPGTPTALTETTARSPVPRVTSTVETAGVPGPSSRSTTSTPAAASPARTRSATGPAPSAVTSTRADPERRRRRRRVRRRTPERDVQAAGDDLLVGRGQPVDHLHDVERRQAAADEQRRHATRAGCAAGRSTSAYVATPSTRAATSDRRPGADHAAERVRQREAHGADQHDRRDPPPARRPGPHRAPRDAGDAARPRPGRARR